MATFNPKKWFRNNPKDEDRQKTSGFNELINGQTDEEDELKHPRSSGFNEVLNQSNELAPEDQLRPQQVAQPDAPPDDSFDQGRSSGLNRAGQPSQRGSGQPTQESSGSDGGPERAEKAEVTPEAKPEAATTGEAAKPTEKPSDKDHKAKDEAKKDHKPAKESDKAAGGGEKPAKAGKKTEGGAGKGGKSSSKSAGRGRLAGRFGSIGKFAGERRNEIAIGAGIMGIFFGALIFIASVAPLKVVDMMENIYSHRFNRVSHAYHTRKNKIVKKYFGDWFCGHKTTANTCEKFVDNAVVDDARKGFFNNISTNMRHSDFNDSLAKNGYKIEVTSTNNLNIYKNGELISDYSLLTDKASARHDVNIIFEDISKSEGWFKRWRSKRWFQKISGTKWHWLDPINQPIEKVKKKVISDVVDYLLKNKLTSEFANKIVSAVIGAGAETELNAGSYGGEVVEKTATIFEEKIAQQAAVETLENGVPKAIGPATAEAATVTGSKFATAIADASNPIGWAILVIQIGCGALNMAHDQTIQHVLAEYSQIQYITMFTKYQSISSQIKEGGRDGKMGDAELHSNIDLLSSADGKQDVVTSNNYQRSTGNPVPYNVDSDDVKKCESGKELCRERQPNHVLESTLFGKAILGGLASLDPDTRRELLGDGFGDKWNPLDPGSIYNQVTCKAVGAITNALSWLVGKAFEAFKGAVEKCAGVPGLGDSVVIPAPGGPPMTCNQWKELFDNGSKIAAEVFKWINEHIIAPLLTLIIAQSDRGANMVNAVSAGAEYAANSQAKDLDADPLNKDQLAESEHRYYAELRQQHQNASIAEKMFSLDDNYSLASRVLHGTPSSGRAFAGQAIAFISSTINPANAVKNIYSGSGTIARVGSPQAIADQPVTAVETGGAVVNEFGMRVQDNSLGEVYGFSEKDLTEEPLGSDKMKKLDEQAACSMVANIGVKDEDKPQECRDNESNGSTGGGPGEVISGNGDYIWPLKPKGALSQCYGNNGHPGLDISAAKGTGIFATHEGTVVQAHDGGDYNGGAGNYVSIDHGNGVFTRYLHMNTGSVKVHSGDHVDKGQQIGEVNNTGYSKGDHLHIEYRTGGEFGGGSQTHNFLAFTNDTEGVGSLNLCPKTDGAQ